jgi:hypothetical protein
MKSIHDLAAEALIKPAKAAPGPLKSDKILAALASVASTDPDRSILNAVLIAGGMAVATDGCVLLAVPYTGPVPAGRIYFTSSGAKRYPALNNTRIAARRVALDADNSVPNEASNAYPDWRALVPALHAPASYTLTPQDEAAIAVLGKDASKGRQEDKDVLSIQIGDERVYLPIYHLAKLIAAVRKLGTTGPLVVQPTLSTYSTGFQANPCLLTASAGALALIAVIMVGRPRESSPRLN